MSDHKTWAAGYTSSPAAVDDGTWARWQREIEAHARTHGLRLVGVFTDPPAATLSHPEELNPDPERQRLVHLIRERANLRARHISYLLVPSIAHLAPTRDGTHDMVRTLLELHFGLRVQPVVIASGHMLEASIGDLLSTSSSSADLRAHGPGPDSQQVMHGSPQKEP